MYCKGRIQGEHPIYLPDVHPYTKSIVHEAHERILHGGVGLTMTKVRERYWVPRLRQLLKKVIKECFKCRRFQAKPVARPPVGNLPRDRTDGNRPFQVVGVVCCVGRLTRLVPSGITYERRHRLSTPKKKENRKFERGEFITPPRLRQAE